MKTNLCVVVFSIVVLCTSCTKEKITPPEPDTPAVAIARSVIEKTNECLISGNWQITYYQKANTERSEVFKNYDFKFLTNGNLIATRYGQDFVGKWVISYIDGMTRLSIDFIYPASFIEVSGDWTVTDGTENMLKMRNVVLPGDYLTIEKK